MQYQLEIEINLPRERVVELFNDPKLLMEWQPTLQRQELIKGEPRAAGAKTRLWYKMGSREVEMLETIVSTNLPDSIEMTYDANKVFNACTNRFVEIDADRTRYEFETTFKCKGPMWVVSKLMPNMFKKSSEDTLKLFKAFAESYG